MTSNSTWILFLLQLTVVFINPGPTSQLHIQGLLLSWRIFHFLPLFLLILPYFSPFFQCCTSKVCGALLLQLSSHPLTLWPPRKLASALRRLVILLLQITNWPLTLIQRTFLSSWSVMCLQFWHWWPQHDNNTIYWILHARYCAKNLTHITSFNPHKKIR